MVKRSLFLSPFIMIWLATGGTLANAAFEQPLVAPSGYAHSAYAEPPRVFNCSKGPTPFTSELLFSSRYEGDDGGTRSQVNKVAEQRYLEAIKDIRALETFARQMGDAFSNRDALGARRCYFATLEDWANQHALLHESVNHVGEAMRKWALASIASNYLKMKSSSEDLPEFELAQEKTIENWLVQLSDEVQEFYSDRPYKQVNNHDYWAGFSVMLVSIIVNDEQAFQWSLKKFQEGLDHIDAEGYLVNEMKRGALALKYQNFAIQPLVMMAALAKANDSLNSAQMERLSKAIDALAIGIEAPQVFSSKTGFPQNTESLRKGYSLAWVPVWQSIHGEADLSSLDLIVEGSYASTRMGGDMDRLFRPPTDE